MAGVARVFARGSAGRDVGREMTLAEGTGAQVGACAREGRAADTLCDRSRRDALRGSSLASIVEEVGRVATMA